MKAALFLTISLLGLMPLAAEHSVHTYEGETAELATTTNTHVFRLLKNCGIPVAFEKQLDEQSFLSTSCEIFPNKVVVKRHSHAPHEWGLRFSKLQVDGAANQQMERIAKKTFLILEKAWQLEEGRLDQLELEFGIDSEGNMRIAGVIDNDSWKVVQEQRPMNKRAHALYHYVSEVTGRFRLPHQQIILLQGCQEDHFHSFLEKMMPYVNDHLIVNQISLNSDRDLQELILEVPDAVAVFLTDEFDLPASTTIPVINDSDEDVALNEALEILSERNPLLYMQWRMRVES